MALRVPVLCILALSLGCSVDSSSPILEGQTETDTEGTESTEESETGEEPEPSPELAWRVELDSEFEDVVGDIEIDAEGRIHVVGWLRFPDPPPQDFGLPRQEGFVAVYSPAGEELERTLWQAETNVEWDQVMIQELEIGADGTRYVAGRTNGVLGGVGMTNGSDLVFVAELDPSSEPSWVQLFEAFDDSYEEPEALALSPSGELLMVWGSVESMPIFGFPVHYLTRISPSGEVEAEVELELGQLAFVADLASEALGERLYVAGTLYNPSNGGFLARLDPDLNPLGLSLLDNQDSFFSGVAASDAGAYVVGSVFDAQLGEGRGVVARYDAEGVLLGSNTELGGQFMGLEARGAIHVSGRDMEVVGLGEQVQWSVALPTRGGEFEEVRHIAVGPGGEIAAAGVFRAQDAELGDAFLALLLPPG